MKNDENTVILSHLYFSLIFLILIDFIMAANIN
jgi:hypothetical protein